MVGPADSDENDPAFPAMGQTVVVQGRAAAEATLARITATLVAALIVEETALATGPAAVAAVTEHAAAFGAMLRLLLWPRVGDRTGPSEGAFGKRGCHLVELASPRAVAFALAASPLSLRDSAIPGPLSCLGPQCSTTRRLSEAQCTPANGFASGRHDDDDDVAAFWEAEFEGAWRARVPPKRRN
jgi:hypothetical protein